MISSKTQPMLVSTNCMGFVATADFDDDELIYLFIYSIHCTMCQVKRNFTLLFFILNHFFFSLLVPSFFLVCFVIFVDRFGWMPLHKCKIKRIFFSFKLFAHTFVNDFKSNDVVELWCHISNPTLMWQLNWNQLKKYFDEK